MMIKFLFQALEKEVGDTVNIQAILNGTSNWRGRQQQIIALQEKVFIIILFLVEKSPVNINCLID